MAPSILSRIRSGFQKKLNDVHCTVGIARQQVPAVWGKENFADAAGKGQVQVQEALLPEKRRVPQTGPGRSRGI
jgi:hypothetical protein